MAAIYHPNVIQVVPHHNIGAPHDAVCVLNFMGVGWPFTTTQLAAVQTAFNTPWANFWKPLANTQDHYLGCVVTDVSSNTGLQVPNTGFTPVAGLDTFPVQGDQVAALVSFKTPIRYRGGHGRIYVPGISSGATHNDGRTMDPTTLTNANTNFAALIGAMNGIGAANGGPFQLIVWHKKLKALPNSVEIVFNTIVQSVLATQRRRLRKVARHRKLL